MAGAIKISDGEGWSAASWVFDHVLRQSVPFIPAENERLLSEVKKGVIEDGLDYIDLSEVSHTDKRVFLRALEDGFRLTESQGDKSFADPEFYPGFIERFKELIDAVSSNVAQAEDGQRGADNGEI